MPRDLKEKKIGPKEVCIGITNARQEWPRKYKKVRDKD